MTNETHVPRVSIGMPVYNAAQYLRPAIDSLLAQTFTDFELIISDNASTDETDAICKQYEAQDSRVKYIKQAKNKGGLANFNVVLNAAHGDYFMWAAGDDVWDSRWIERLLSNFTPQTAISFGATATTDEHLNVLKLHTKYRYMMPRALRLLAYFLTPERGKGNLIHGLMRRELIQSVGFVLFNGCTAGTGAGEDFHLVFKLIEYGHVRVDESVTMYKRTTYERSRRGRLSVYQIPFEALKSLLFSVNKDKLFYLLTYVWIPTHLVDRILIGLALPFKILTLPFSQLGYMWLHLRGVLRAIFQNKNRGTPHRGWRFW